MNNKKNRPTWLRLKEARQQNRELKATIEQLNDQLTIAKTMRNHCEQNYDSAMNLFCTINKQLSKAIEIADNYSTQIVELKARLRRFEDLEAKGFIRNLEKTNLKDRATW